MLYQRNQAKIRKHHLSLKRQQGVVIVMALFIVALVATMSYVMMSRLERDTRRTSLILSDTQAAFNAQGSVAWAIDTLRTDWEKQKPNQIIDPIPIKSPVNEVNGYKIKSTIYDMQARFNINNLVNANVDAQADFKHMLLLVEPKLGEEKAQEIVKATMDWISPANQQNEFSQYYSQLPLAYRAAHRPMQSVTELQLVKGMTPPLFNALRPYVIALPVTTQINVQTAPGLVYATLNPTMTLESGLAIERLRNQTPIVTTQAFLSLDVVKNHPIKPEKIIDKSSYFLVETDVAIEMQHTVLYTLLERMMSQDKATVNILWQSKGFW